MKTLLAFTLALLGLLGRASGEDVTPVGAALARGDVPSTWLGNGRDQLTLTVRNASDQALRIVVPAGLIAEAKESRERVIVLRESVIAILAGGTVETALPVAALSAKNKGAAGQIFAMTKDTDARLAGLLKYLADKPDAPRPTAQLAVLALLEDLNFAQWRTFLAPPPETPPTPVEVTQAIDALGIVRSLEPAKIFALGTDTELKRLALRNPWCRAKAMQLYGITLPGSDGAVPPDIGQLLHSKPGDNCPICRQRTEMQASPNGL